MKFRKIKIKEFKLSNLVLFFLLVIIIAFSVNYWRDKDKLLIDKEYSSQNSIFDVDGKISKTFISQTTPTKLLKSFQDEIYYHIDFEERSDITESGFSRLGTNSDPVHPDHYEFVGAWDTGGGQDVKVGPDGNIYLSSGPMIKIFDVNGNFITSWTDAVHIEDINGFDFDSHGNLYAMESSSNQVVKLDNQGSFVLTWEIGDSAVTNRIACDSRNNVYVINYDTNQILKYNSNGSFIRSWTPWDGSSCLGIDSQDFVYVAGSLIQKFNINGEFIKKWESPLNEGGSLITPHGMAIDSLNAVYVAEIDVGRIQKFDSEGEFITEFGSDEGQGQLSRPAGITVADDGLVYVIDEGNGKIQIYSPHEIHPITESPTTTTTTVDRTIEIDPMSSLVATIILPIPIALVLLGMLFWINRLISKVVEDK